MRSFIHRRFCGLLRVALLASLAFACEPGGTQSLSPTLSLDGAVQAATAQSQRVVAAQAQTRAARERVSAAGQLPDPVLTFGINDLPVNGRDRFSLTRDSFTQRTVGVMQEFTRSDKRLARTERAQREVEATQIAQRSTIADLQRDTALAWLDRSLHESMHHVLRAQLTQTEQQVEAAQTLYRNGKGTQADVYAARAEVEQQRDRIAQIERQIAVATTRLARWIGDDAKLPVGARPTLVLPAWTQGDLTEHLVRQPRIAAALQRQALADSEVLLARALKQADWSVELTYSQRGSAYSNMVSVSVSVPLQWDQKNRQDRELDARLAEVERARADGDDVQRDQEAELRTMLQEWRSADERLHRHDSALLPLAEQRSAAALAAYASGSGSLPMLLEARRSELEVHIERLRIEMDRARLWAHLNYLLPNDEAPGATPSPSAFTAVRSAP